MTKQRLRYVDKRGGAYTGRTAAGVVRQLRASAWLTIPKGDYMREVADRVSMLTRGRAMIATTSPAVFLKDLERAGFLRRVEDKPKPARS